MSGLGRLVVISGPSGVGKTTLCNSLLAALGPTASRVVTCTTRSPRKGERDGVDYRFLSREQFEDGIRGGRFLEHAEVHGHLYGTPRDDVARGIAGGQTLLLSIDVQGARALRAAALEGLETFFVVPPSREELRRRLSSRCTDSAEEVERRLQAAEREMDEKDHFDHVVTNDDLDRAVEEVREVIAKETVARAEDRGG